jgi:hypothetical protein
MELMEQVHELHRQGKRHKEHLMDDHGERNMQPHCELLFLDHGALDILLEEFGEMVPEAIQQNVPLLTSSCLLLMHQIWSGELSEQFADLGKGWTDLPDRDDTLVAVCFSGDGYVMMAADGTPEKRGDIKRDFETNPDSKVTEALTTTVVRRNSVGWEWGTVISPYVVTDGGHLAWLADRDIETSGDESDEMQGELLQVLIAAARHYGGER